MIPATLKGDCDCCSKTDVALTIRNKMSMCADCVAAEDAVMIVKTTAIIAEARTVDTSIQIKTDIFNATTIASSEIKAAIDNNPEIPVDQKDYVMAQEMLARFKHVQQVIFDTRVELQNQESRLRAYQTLVQTYAGQLRNELKEQFKNFDITYQPAPTKKAKSTSTSSPSNNRSALKKNELKDACSKYGVDAVLVRMTMIQKNLNADGAAQHVARSMGLLK